MARSSSGAEKVGHFIPPIRLLPIIDGEVTLGSIIPSPWGTESHSCSCSSLPGISQFRHILPSSDMATHLLIFKTVGLQKVHEEETASDEP